MPLFGSDSDMMRAGMAPGMQQGAPAQGAPTDGPQAGPAPGPQAVPPGTNVQPGPTEMALANQVHRLQQMVLQLQAELMNFRNGRQMMTFDFHRDNDGRLVGMSANEAVK